MEQPLTLKAIAHLHNDFPTKFGLPRQSGLVENLPATIVFTPEYRNPHALPGAGRLLPYLADLGVFQSPASGLVSHRPSAPAGRKPADGSLCDPFPLPPQRPGALLREAGKN